MEWLVWMVAVAILGLAAVAASGRLGEFPATVTDTPQPHVPGGSLTGADLRALRFAVVPRGYSMQQVDELLDRVSRQLEQGPSGEDTLETPAHAWVPDEAEWDEAEPVGHGVEVEPQPPLNEETEVPPLRPAEPPAAPSWQAAELVVAPDAGVEDESPEPVAASETDAPAAAGEVIGAETGPVQPAPAEDSDPSAQTGAPEPAADTPEPVAQPEAEPDVTPAATAKPRAKREPKAKPTPEPADAPSADDLDDEIARIGTGQANPAGYGAALDDLVSKYSFRKVEHWYELPGFDLPASSGSEPADETAEPTQESTSADS